MGFFDGNQFDRTMRQLVAKGAPSALARAGAALAADARRRCPVDAGELRDSIGHVVDVATLSVRVIASAGHAFAVEYGTARSRAQPFLRPAYTAFDAGPYFAHLF
jgi:HK97 gp10 family phage protein